MSDTTAIDELGLHDALKNHYGLSGELLPLAGYDEINFLLKSEGKKYTVKVNPNADTNAFIEGQVQALDYLSSHLGSKYLPSVIKTQDERLLVPFSIKGKRCSLRVLSYLGGKPMAHLDHYPEAFIEDLGELLGKMDRCLQNFNHPAIFRLYDWDLSRVLDNQQKTEYINDIEKKRLVQYFLLQYETGVVPKLPGFPMSVIHSDANEYNVLQLDGQFSGLIDFGDMVYSHRVNNIAIACAYAMLGQAEPLTIAGRLIGAYHKHSPLSSEETSVIYYLIAARLCMSVCQSAYMATISTNKHHFVTENDAWGLLYKLIEINPLKAENSFRLACGYPSLIKNNHANLLNKRRESIGLNLSISYQDPLKIEKGALQYLYDDQGNTYVDCVNNVSHIGHCHPVLVKAMQRQIAKLNTNTRYLHDGILDYVNLLLKTLPKHLSVCFFTNSGSESNDLAIRMSRHFTGQQDVIVLDHAYHGTSTTALELSPYKFDGKGGAGKKEYIHKALNPDTFRGPYKADEPDAGAKYAGDIDRILESLESGKGIAAFICETLLGVGGQIPLPTNYLKEVYRKVRKAGGICIADEVQVGFGRVGRKFWGFELQDVVPDIVVLGKPMGNGHPLSAVVVSREIAEAFDNGMEYFNTYGGNPVSMETGKTVLKVIENERMQAHALEIGTYFLEKLFRLKQSHEIIGDVRGEGLFLGVELVKDRQTLEPAVDEARQIVEKMKEKGFLISTDGPYNNVLKIKPPLVFNKKNVDGFVTALDSSF